jgi:hypothetical protein
MHTLLFLCFPISISGRSERPKRVYEQKRTTD